MIVYDYIDNYGIYTFEEKPFNEVDSMIFAFLSYADYTKIFDEKSTLTINEIARMHIGLHKEKDRNIIAVKEANKLIRYIKDSRRFKDCVITNYEYIGNDEVQFGALIIEYMKNHLYVSFEGTDQLFSGWKENFILSYEFPIISHKKAIDYLNRHCTFTTKRLIIGGHSKGGNLALIASMYANVFVRNKIDAIYSGDGPGVLDKEYYSERYQKIKSKYYHLIPDHSLVGLVLNTSNNKVVNCSEKNILSHNSMLWEVEDNHFVETKLSPISTEMQEQLKNWFYRYNDEERKEFVTNLFQVLDHVGVRSILDIKEKKSRLLKIIHETKELSESSKKMMNDFINTLIKSATNIKKEEFKNTLNNILKSKKDKKIEIK